MQPSSAKAKGRLGQQEVAAMNVAKTELRLQGDDITSRPMGSPGEDLIVSPWGLKRLYFRPWEIKRRRRISLVRWIDQCMRSLTKKKVLPQDQHPIVCFREDHGEWYCAMKLADCLELLAIRANNDHVAGDDSMIGE